MAETIAALVRNAKHRRDTRMKAAIRDWEQDLKQLHDESYVGTFSFGWPTTMVCKQREKSVNAHFQRVTGSVPSLFAKLMSSEPFTAKGTADQKGRPGIYVFFDGDTPVHAGRTRNLGGRLRGHVTKSHYSASFAFKCARRALNMIATYTPEGSRAFLAKDEVFRPEFHRQVERVKGLSVRFIEVADPVQQYVLELYACLELGLPLDEFETH